MRLPIANGIEGISVTLLGRDPLDYTKVDLRGGLTVLFGADGAGKAPVVSDH